MRRLFSALLALLLLTACSPVQRTEEDEVDWQELQQQAPQEEAPAPEEPDYPAAFSLAYQKDRTLDPIACGEGVQQDVASLIYEPLFRLDASFEPQPVLCESWEWDEAGMACTLALREGVTFQDGSALRAQDVAATLQRAAASERYAYRLRGVASISANRSGQVVIALTAPNRGLPALLDIPIVKAGTEDRIAPVGTGPYLFSTGEDGEDYLSASPDWWQGKSLPVQTIRLVHAKDRASAMYLFSSRRTELLAVDPTDDLTAVAGQYETASQPTSILQFIGFNTRQGVFASPEARRVFSQGIPRETLARAQMAGLAQAAQFPIHPLSPLYPKELEAPYDRDAALAALTALDAREEGEGDGEDEEDEDAPLVLLVNEEDAFRFTSARFIADSLSIGGVWQIEVRTLPWEEYLAALEAGDFDLYFGEVRLTADWDLSGLAGTEGALNYGGYSDEMTDLLLADFAAGLDRSGNARRLAQNLAENAPIAPVCFRSYTVLTHPGVVEGLAPTPGGTFAGMEGWTVHLAD